MPVGGPLVCLRVKQHMGKWTKPNVKKKKKGGSKLHLGFTMPSIATIDIS